MHDILIAPMAFPNIEAHTAFKSALAAKADAFRLTVNPWSGSDGVLDALHRQTDPYQKKLIGTKDFSKVDLAKDMSSVSMYVTATDDALIETNYAEPDNICKASDLQKTLLKNQTFLNKKLQSTNAISKHAEQVDNLASLLVNVQTIAKDYGFSRTVLSYVYASSLVLVNNNEFTKARDCFLPLLNAADHNPSLSRFTTYSGVSIINTDLLVVDVHEWMAFEIRLQILLNRAYQINSYLESKNNDVPNKVYYLSRATYSSIMSFASQSPMPELAAVHETAINDTAIDKIANAIDRKLIDIHDEATNNIADKNLSRAEALRTKEKRFENFISLLVSLGVVSTIAQTIATIDSKLTTPIIFLTYLLAALLLTFVAWAFVFSRNIF